MNTASLSAPSLLSMTKASLLNYAAQNGVEGVNSSMRKADIISAIEGVL